MKSGHKTSSTMKFLTVCLLCLSAVTATLPANADGRREERQRGDKSNRTGGQVVGGILGALLGSQVGKGDGRIVGAAAGGILGAIIGGNVADNMSERDRYESVNTLNSALYDDYRPNYRYQWRGPNYYGYYQFSNHGYYDNVYCRQYQSFAYDIYGRPYPVASGYMCHGNRGWQRYESGYRFRQYRSF